MITIIICEGIPTCGKSTLIRKMKAMADQPVLVFGYQYKDLIANKMTIEQAVAKLTNDLKAAISRNPKTIFIHNFHLYQAVVNGQENLDAFAELEALLKEHNPLLAYIEVQGRIMLKQFRETSKGRKERGEDCSFDKVLEEKGTGLQQMAYYTVQQKKYKELFHKTILNAIHVTLTKDSNYDDMAKEIFDKTKQFKDFLEFSA